MDRMERGQDKECHCRIGEKVWNEGTCHRNHGEEVVEHFGSRKRYKGKVIIDYTIKAAIDAYYEQYGAEK